MNSICGIILRQLPIIKYLVLLFFCLANTCSFAETGKQLTLNTTLNPPLGSPSQDGFIDQIAAKVFSRVGLSIKSFEYPAQRALLDANAGILDGELARVAGIEKFYHNLLIIPEKLMDVEFTIFSIKHNRIDPGWDSLNNKAVAFLNGWKILERNIPPTAEITKVNSPEQLFNLLKLDRVDYIIYEKWGGIALADNMDIKNIYVLSPPLAVKPLHIFLHKKHKEYVDPISEALKKIKSDGEYQNIYTKILAPYLKKHEQ